ncbi:Major capsid protein precursor (GpN) [Escherichia coli]|nr:Major capsid protein precursor (GpN) [Escherichia coli]
MNDVTLTSRNMDNTVAHAGKYANADALVQDARSSLLDEWHKEADDLAVIMGRNLFNSLRLPVLNSISGQNPNAELLAGSSSCHRAPLAGWACSLRRSSRMQRCLSPRSTTCRFTGRKVQCVA